MRERVTISYRGAGYEIGKGRDYYAIWAVGAPRSQPVERWPVTREGWFAAWARFTSVEAPGAITPVRRGPALLGPAPMKRAAAGPVAAAVLLAAGVAAGIGSLFPAYTAGASLASQPDELVLHVIYLVAWSVSAVLIALGGTRSRVGALLGLGVSIVTFGMFFADAGVVIAGGTHLMGVGLVLGLVGWLACAAGSVLGTLAALARPNAQPGALPNNQPGDQPGARAGGLGPVLRGLRSGRLPRRPRGPELGAAVILILAALGTAVTFAPSWDSYTLHTPTGFLHTLTQGDAFANPAPVIAGDILVMVLLVVVVIGAALWRPARHGAALLAGAIIPMAGQAVSALVAAGEPTSPTQFGISNAQAQQAGLTISNGLTAVFWLYCLFLIVLAVSCAWLLIAAQPAAPAPPPASAPAPPPASAPAAYSPQPPPADAGHPAASAGVQDPSS